MSLQIRVEWTGLAILALFDTGERNVVIRSIDPDTLLTQPSWQALLRWWIEESCRRTLLMLPDYGLE
jgi:hypothetical protein